MSRMVTTGEDRPQGLPVVGLVEAGPVVPVQPPMTLAQITKKRSVSTGLPGPIIEVHQPPLPVIGFRLATYWSPVSAWQSRIALDFAALSSP
ncbi:hypothetical protein BTHI11S_00558 [Bosea thiooxidans]